MFYFTIDRINMQLVGKIRYDMLPGARSPNVIAFYEPSYDFDYFTYVRNVPTFSSSTTNEILLNRKALLYSNDNKFDCRPSDVLTDEDLDIDIATYNAANDCSVIIDDLPAAGEWII